MKRFFLGDSSEHLPLISKLAKVKDTFFSKFIHTPQTENVAASNEQPANTLNANRSLNSSFNNSQTPITARQLQAYYNSLRLQNEELTENLEKNTQELRPESSNTSTSNKSFKKNTVNWNNAESTNIEIEGSIIQNKSEAQDNKNNTVILYNENKHDSDIDLDDYSQSLGLPPIVSQPDPLERANLVQLKKMMELEKYRRYRLNYLREHTRNVNRSAIHKVSKNITKNKISKAQRVDIKKLPKERQNTSGIFGISLLDTVEDKDIEAELDTVKPIEDDITKKIKFADTKSSSATFTMPSKPKGFNINDLKKDTEVKPDVKINVSEKPEPIIATPVKTPAFTFETTKSKLESEIDDKPSTAFNFNPAPIKESISIKPASTSPTPAFTLNTSAPSTSEPKKEKPKISFGFTTPAKTEVNKVILENVPDVDGLNDSSMDFKHKKPAVALPSFNFPKTESSTVTPKVGTKLPPLFDSKSASTPAFTIKTLAAETPKPSSSSFTFGQTATSDSIKLPSFNFSAPASEEKSKPTFGTPPVSTSSSSLPSFSAPLKATEEKTEEKKPFSFAPVSKPESPSGFSLNTSTTTAPKISFGDSTPKDSADDKPKSLFGGFGATTTATNPTTVFGGLSEPKKDAAPSFGFGSGFSLGKTDAPKETTPAATTPSEPAKLPSLNFGGFGGLSASKPDAETTEEPKKSAFDFGSTGSAFGNTPAATENKPTTPAFGSLGTTGALDEAAAGSKFSFGLNTGSNDLTKLAASTVPSLNLKAPTDSSTPNTTAIFSGFGNNASSTTTSTLNTTNLPSSLPKLAGLPKMGEVKNTATVGSGFSLGGNSTSAFGSNTTITAFGNNNDTNKNTRKFDSMSDSLEQQPKKRFGGPSGFGGSNNDSNKSASGGFSNNNSGLGSTGFGFGTAGNNNNNGAASNGSGSAFGSAFGSQPNNQPPPGKIFSLGNSTLPSLGQTPFGGGNSSNNSSSGFNFGNNNNNNNGNAGQSAFGGMSNNNNNGFGGANNNNNNAVSAFGNGFNSGNSTRSNTPSFNFTGQATNVDPSAIFQQSQNSTPPPGMNMAMGMGGVGMSMNGQQQQQPQNTMTRRRAYPRSMRGGANRR